VHGVQHADPMAIPDVEIVAVRSFLLIIIYSPDGTTAYGSTGGEFKVVGSL